MKYSLPYVTKKILIKLHAAYNGVISSNGNFIATLDNKQLALETTWNNNLYLKYMYFYYLFI